MKINESLNLKEIVQQWANERNYDVTFVERGTAPSFGVETEKWGIEVLAQDGWAYVNGYKSLSDFSTNVSETEDIPDTLDRLLTHLPE